jgi:hypothetical protein
MRRSLPAKHAPAQELAQARAAWEALESVQQDQERREQQIRVACELMERFEPAWEHLNLMERREVLRQLVEWITVDVDEHSSGPPRAAM